jgi:NAD(P)-dependent dehydrogenase (short-subunit alcohol dehydrogenase family)
MADWLRPGNNAVITGGASGIGLAAARHYLAIGMNVLIADLSEDALAHAVDDLGDGAAGKLHTQVCDVADFQQVRMLQETAGGMGNVHCLMNNAGAGLPPSAPWENLDRWKQQLDVNLWGIIHGVQAFVPAMLEAGEPAAVINTGSKQGITNPPGGYAYNLSKAGVKAYTESLAHALREIENCPLSAHLMIPGFTYTGMIARFVPEQPPGAWTSKQVVEFMLAALQRGDFYILCPDNDTPRELDEKRIQWNTDDLIHNRPALSRWDARFADAYESYIKE